MTKGRGDLAIHHYSTQISIAYEDIRDMQSKTERIEFVSWSRFRTRDLVVRPDLLGLSHEFSYDRSLVRVELPPSDDLDRDIRFDQRRLNVRSHRTSDGVLTGVEVMSVDVTVSQNETIEIPARALDVPPIAVELFSEDEQNRLRGLVESYRAIAEAAFDLWLRTLRWKCVMGFIGRPEIYYPETSRSTDLLDADTKKPFWLGMNIAGTVYINSEVELEEWEFVGRALKNGEKPPVYYDLLFDAREHFKIGDYNRAIVDAAVACEAYLRMLVEQELPEDLNIAFREYIEKANISRVREVFIPKVLNEDESMCFREITPKLKKLFEFRNRILHAKPVEELSKEKCKRYIDATYRLITLR